MNIEIAIIITKMIKTCPVCGDNTVGNGSKFIIEDETFERTCRKCGWRITGKIENDKVIIKSDNREKLNR